ncbi:MAG: helix-turn-helix domain-containing protein [Bacteroidaceae bacterium]|nr:helix-turn-helix domain-containing protein [Bacteroidaceae bacterium]
MRDRLNTLMELLDMTPTQFATAIGIQRPTLQHILSGRNEPSLKIVKCIHSTFPDIDLDWLLTGTGNPRKSAVLPDSHDYPLFSGTDSAFFQPAAGNVSEFSNVRKETKPSKRTKSADNKDVDAQNTASQQCVSKHIKEVVVFFEDGTYQKFQPELKK